MDAIIFLGLLVVLALAASCWGHDSTDGVDSPEYRRRAAWWADRHGRASLRPTVGRSPRPAVPRPLVPVYKLRLVKPDA